MQHSENFGEFFDTETTPRLHPCPYRSLHSRRKLAASRPCLHALPSSDKETCLQAGLHQTRTLVFMPPFVMPLSVRKEELSSYHSSSDKTCPHVRPCPTRLIITLLITIQDLSSCCSLSHKTCLPTAFTRQKYLSSCWSLSDKVHVQAGLHQTRFHAALCKAPMFSSSDKKTSLHHKR